MAVFCWDSRKNEKLKAERGVTFDEVIWAVANGHMLALLDHSNQRKYPDSVSSSSRSMDTPIWCRLLTGAGR